ncbi:hypothetical protein FACS189490_00120 [Clostridia bacterium]|nr:hypothetical protein FACS189490_00120 [Clostridia bacterium]
MKINFKKILIPIVCLAVILSFTLPEKSLASGTAGTVNDPLATQSYVEARFKELQQLIALGGSPITTQPQQVLGITNEQKDAIIDEVMAQIKFLGGVGISTPAKAPAFTPVFVQAGKTVIFKEGAEVILRSGAAVAVVPGTDGLSDITAGADILNGGNIPANHLLIIARSDGRGIAAQKDSWFLIKGEYDGL